MSMNLQINDLHGEKCSFTNSIYNCPRLKLFGYSTEIALSRRIAAMKRVLRAQTQLCADYSSKLQTSN